METCIDLIASVVVGQGDNGTVASVIERMVEDGNVCKLSEQAFGDLVDLAKNNRNLIAVVKAVEMLHRLRRANKSRPPYQVSHF